MIHELSRTSVKFQLSAVDYNLSPQLIRTFSLSVKITKLCQQNHKSFLSTIPRTIDGALLISKNERDLNCIITFQTESILERFMLRFEELQIDCNDKLMIYDGSHAIGQPKVINIFISFQSFTLSDIVIA
jgi:hypothetical protein